jgi:ribosomal protein S18 acetylase RimI-like enzyme
VSSDDGADATYLIRAATAEDAGPVLALWREAGAVVSATDDAEGIEALVAHDPGALLVVDGDERLLGSIVAAWDGWRGQIYRLAVHPDARRRGLGTALVRAAEHRLEGLGARRIGAIVMDDHEHALAFWQAVGYEHGPQTRFTRTLQVGG